MKPETTFKLRVKRDLDKVERLWYLKTNEVSTVGIPDFLICAAGIFIALEIKRDASEDPTELQKYNLRKIRTTGGYGMTACPENWDEKLKRIKQVVKWGISHPP